MIVRSMLWRYTDGRFQQSLRHSGIPPMWDGALGDIIPWHMVLTWLWHMDVTHDIWLWHLSIIAHPDIWPSSDRDIGQSILTVICVYDICPWHLNVTSASDELAQPTPGASRLLHCLPSNHVICNFMDPRHVTGTDLNPIVWFNGLTG